MGRNLRRSLRLLGAQKQLVEIWMSLSKEADRAAAIHSLLPGRA
jgi:hypothetical protein